MAQSKISGIPYLVETSSLQFTNGYALVPLKSGYELVNVFDYGRPTTESNDYSVLSISKRTDGYKLQNRFSTLTANITAVLIWVKT